MNPLNPITFVGNINLLKEKTQRTQKEIELDDIAEENIVYPDLVFTLSQDSKKYYRPKVREEEGGLVVISNPLFFRAAREAGISRIKFDVIPPFEGPLGEAWMERYNLSFPPEPKLSDTLNLFLFFCRTPKQVDLSGLNIFSFNENRMEQYQKMHCLGYEVPAYCTRDELDLVERALTTNGLLRSVNGLRGVGIHRKYFKKDLPSSSE